MLKFPYRSSENTATDDVPVNQYSLLDDSCSRPSSAFWQSPPPQDLAKPSSSSLLPLTTRPMIISSQNLTSIFFVTPTIPHVSPSSSPKSANSTAPDRFPALHHLIALSNHHHHHPMMSSLHCPIIPQHQPLLKHRFVNVQWTS